MNASSAICRAALDPSLSLLVDRYECSQTIAIPQGGWRRARLFTRAISIGLGTVATTIGAYFLQLGR